jgi:tRNA threonylcarbamoyladenosine biosynthesis protein TsaB
VVASGETVLGAQRDAAIHGQAERLLPMVDAVMRAAGLSASALDIIGVTIGPGSFTGIRVGLATARGLALATRAQLIGVSGFEAVAAGLAGPFRSGDIILTVLESRREDIYMQLFDHACDPLGDPAAIMPVALDEVLNGIIGRVPLLIAGDSARRTASILAQRPGLIVVEGSAPDAAGVLRAVLKRQRVCARTVKPRPLYLRPPDVTILNTPQRAGR